MNAYVCVYIQLGFEQEDLRAVKFQLAHVLLEANTEMRNITKY